MTSSSNMPVRLCVMEAKKRGDVDRLFVLGLSDKKIGFNTVELLAGSMTPAQALGVTRGLIEQSAEMQECGSVMIFFVRNLQRSVSSQLRKRVMHQQISSAQFATLLQTHAREIIPDVSDATADTPWRVVPLFRP